MMRSALSTSVIAAAEIPDPAWVWDVPFEVAGQVLWMLVGRHWPDPADPRALRRFAPSPFEAAVHQVIEFAPADQRQRLAVLYPQQVYAWMIVELPGGVELLREVVRRKDPAVVHG